MLHLTFAKKCDVTIRVLTKIHNACPECGALPGAPCTRGRRGKVISVFHATRPAQLGEYITRYNTKVTQPST